MLILKTPQMDVRNAFSKWLPESLNLHKKRFQKRFPQQYLREFQRNGTGCVHERAGSPKFHDS